MLFFFVSIFICVSVDCYYFISVFRKIIDLIDSLLSLFLFCGSLWCGPGRISGRDFRSYQALLTMHMWFLHKRLVSCQEDPHKAALIQEELFGKYYYSLLMIILILTFWRKFMSLDQNMYVVRIILYVLNTQS